MREKLAIGIDLGGTRIKGALVSKAGLAGDIEILPTYSREGPERVLNQILEIAYRLKSRVGSDGKLLAVGIGVPGPLNVYTGVVQSMPNLPGWSGFPIRRWLSERLEYPVWVMNDADAAAYGEFVFGEAQGIDDFVYLTLGTGVGSSIFIGGRLVVGTSGMSPEFGHIPVSFRGPLCGCGKRGHLESYVSSVQLVGRVMDAVRRGVPSLIDIEALKKGDPVRIIANSARNGDSLALREMHRYGRYLGRGLAVLANLINPSLVILSGGISRAWDIIGPSARRELLRSAFSIQAKAMSIIVSRLQEAAGPLGAAGYALHSIAVSGEHLPKEQIPPGRRRSL